MTEENNYLKEAAFHDLDLILQLAPELKEKKKSIQKQVVAGSYSELAEHWRKHYLGHNWSQIAPQLRLQGAVGLPKREAILIDIGVWSGIHSEVAAEHEVVEQLYGRRQRDAGELLRRLGLKKMISERFPRSHVDQYPHYLAVVHELKMAKEKGVLEENLQIHDELEREAAKGEYAPRLRSTEFDKRFRQKVKAILECR